MDTPDLSDASVEDVVEEEGLQYFTGYLCYKFPQYESFGSRVPMGDRS